MSRKSFWVHRWIAGAALVLAAVCSGAARADWVTATDASGQDGKWANPKQASDGDPAKYASDKTNIANDWGKTLTLNFGAGVACDRLRFNADRWTGAVDKVLIRIYYATGGDPVVKTFYAIKDGQPVAEDAAEGYPNAAYKEVTFAKGTVNKVEFMFHYTKGGYYFWLYELQLFKIVTPVVPPQATTFEPGNVNATSAVVRGRILSDGGEPCAVGFFWGTNLNYDHMQELPGNFAKDEEPSWRLPNLVTGTTYHYCMYARNSACPTGTIARGEDRTFVACPEESEDGSLWVDPLQYYAPLGGWETPEQAFDDWDATAARSYHMIHDEALWSPPLQLHPAPGLYNGLRFKAAKPDNYIDKIKIELEIDSSWQVFYEGPFGHNVWEVKEFPLCALRDARVSFHMSTANVGEYWTLYEFDFKQIGVNLIAPGVPYYREENPGVLIAPKDVGSPLTFKFGPGVDSLGAGKVTIALSPNVKLFPTPECNSWQVLSTLTFDLSSWSQQKDFLDKVHNKTLYVQGDRLSVTERDQFVSCTLTQEVSPGCEEPGVPIAEDKVCYTVANKLDLRADSDRDGAISTERNNEEDRQEDDLANNPLGATIGMGEAGKGRVVLHVIGPIDRDKDALHVSWETVYSLGTSSRTMGKVNVCLPNPDGTLKILQWQDNLLQLTTGTDIELVVVGTGAGCARVKAEWGPYASYRDSFIVSVIDSRLQADNGSYQARTDYEGTSSSPKTLFALMNTTWNDQPAARLDLDFSDVGRADEEIDSCQVTWKAVEQPGGGNFQGNAPGTPAEIVTTKANSHKAVFFAPAAGLYRFEAVLGTVTKNIVAYVGKAKLDSAPDYLFGRATAMVPFEVSFEGTGGKPVEIDDSGTSGRDFHWNLSQPSADNPSQFVDVENAARLPLYRVATTWDAADEAGAGRGQATAYKIVSKDNPLSGVRTGKSGFVNNVRIKVLLSAKVKLDGEETNYVGFSAYRDDARLADNRHLVFELGKSVTYDDAYACLTGIGCYDHLASDDNNEECHGHAFDQLGLASPKESTFTAGDDQRYASPAEKHFHTNATGVRGFDESGDVHVAGMTSPLSAAGLTVEARLYDDGDLWSDDEEEYVAAALGGGVATCAMVSYRPRHSDWLGDFCDTRSEKLSGSVFPHALGSARWRLHVSAERTSQYAEHSSTIYDATGVALGVVALFLSGPPGWLTAAAIVGGASVICSAASTFNDIDSLVAYHDHAAMATIYKVTGVAKWTSAAIGVNKVSVLGTDADAIDEYSGGGIWGDPSAKRTVVVGDHIRTGVEVECSAQNESWEMQSTPDVIGRVTLERLQGNSADLRTVTYESGN